MEKPVLSDLANLLNEATAVAAINANNTTIENSFQNALSRYEGTPNEMNTELDMNEFGILNLPYPSTASSPVRLQDVDNLVVDYSSNSKDYATTNSIPLYEVPLTYVHIRTAGYSNPGDRGGALLKRVTSDPGYPGVFTDALGNFWEIADEEVNPLQFGAAADGVTDDSAAIIDSIEHVMGRGNGSIRILSGSYSIAASIYFIELYYDLHIKFDNGAKLIAATGLEDPVIDLHSGTSAEGPSNYNLIIDNPYIDCSNGTTGVGVQGCTAIATTRFRTVIINNPMLYGGTDPNNANADSGISTVSNLSTWINGGWIQGFGDSGVYPNGNNTVEGSNFTASTILNDGFNVSINGTFFYRNNSICTPKRELHSLTFSGCYCLENVGGIVAAEVVNNSTIIPPVRYMKISDNVFERTVANVVRFVYPCTGEFSDNLVRDWGYYNFDGTSPTGVNEYGLVVWGSRDLKVYGNTFEQYNYTKDYQVGVLLTKHIIDSTEYTEGYHHFDNNTYRNLRYGIYQEVSGVKSVYNDEYFDNVTSETGGFFDEESVLIYSKDDTRRRFLRVKGTIVPLTSEQQTVTAASTTLTDNDSGLILSNLGASALTEFTLPIVVAGAEFTFFNMTTYGLRVKLQSGRYLYSNTGVTTNGGSATNSTVGCVIKVKAMSTTDWIVMSSTGTWTLA